MEFPKNPEIPEHIKIIQQLALCLDPADTPAQLYEIVDHLRIYVNTVQSTLKRICSREQLGFISNATPTRIAKSLEAIIADSKVRHAKRTITSETVVPWLLSVGFVHSDRRNTFVHPKAPTVTINGHRTAGVDYWLGFTKYLKLSTFCEDVLYHIQK